MADADDPRIEYWLAIRFNSNEHPWENAHYNHYPKYVSLDEALEWATYMRDQLTDYTVTLFGDGVVIPIPIPEETYEQIDPSETPRTA